MSKAVIKTSQFMLNLTEELQSKRGVTETTAISYTRTLAQLHDGEPYNTLIFLKKTDKIMKKLEEYSESTKQTKLGTIVGVLKLPNYMAQPSFLKALTFYTDAMNKKAEENKEVAKADVGKKTEREEKNWIEWDDVKAKAEELEKKIKEFSGSKRITQANYNTLLDYIILCLYTRIPPRRNLDYMTMNVVKGKLAESPDTLPKTSNYLVVDTKPRQLVFNVYKTAKKYGTQTQILQEPLRLALEAYLKFHPLNKGRATEFKLLVAYDGTPFTTPNFITRILNRLFNKKVGSSMLRHSYLSQKYDVSEMSDDALAMGHSMAQQKDYLRKETPSDETNTV